MDGEIFQFLLAIAPSLGHVIPKLVDLLKDKKDDELYETLSLSLLAVIAEKEHTSLNKLDNLEQKIVTCDENIGTLLKRTEARDSRRDRDRF